MEYENNTGNEFNQANYDFNSIRRLKENTDIFHNNQQNNLPGI